MERQPGKAARAVLLAITSLGTTSAIAEECKGIQDPTKRLECFDRATDAKPAATKDKSVATAIQAAVRRSLKDPASAQFGKLSFVASDHACQSVNARNSYGGFTGMQQAIVVRMEGQWIAVAIKEISHETCLTVAEQLRKKFSSKSE